MRLANPRRNSNQIFLYSDAFSEENVSSIIVSTEFSVDFERSQCFKEVGAIGKRLNIASRM